ncbi:MAG: 1-acyl-sn-glycerol-3-phosphate acyltransferase, partial [Xanthomonadales bacterium]|nr:1-acyl-sn-glycerol-3-phosphate acyltransferase [Xanthomonadales bacterium]
MNALSHLVGRRDWRRPLRYALRIPLVLLMLLVALPLALAQNPWVARWRVHGEPMDQRLVRWWTHHVLRMIGIRVQAAGAPLGDPVMFVANHCSWLDIVVVHTQRAVCFVAKAEIERWPLFGFLAASAGTIFHRRGKSDSLARVMQVIVARLRAGRSVAVFPEGGAAHGANLKTFHARIFQAGVDADVPIQPMA